MKKRLKMEIESPYSVAFEIDIKEEHLTDLYQEQKGTFMNEFFRTHISLQSVRIPKNFADINKDLGICPDNTSDCKYDLPPAICRFVIKHDSMHKCPYMTYLVNAMEEERYSARGYKKSITESEPQENACSALLAAAETTFQNFPVFFLPESLCKISSNSG